MTHGRPCNGGRSLSEWWRCDRLLMVAAAVYVLIATVNPAVSEPWPLRWWVYSGAVGLLSRRLFGLPRYWAQLWSATVAVSIAAAFLLRAHAYGIAGSWIVLAALLAQELRR